MTTKRTIAKPDPERDPLKVNVFRFVQNCTTALAPMFPYVDEGSIVPCAASFRGGPGKQFGRFQHFNTVDEVAVVMGASGSARRGAGLVRVGPKLHMVEPLPESESADNSLVVVITQRQTIGKAQPEEIRWVCEKCDRRLSMFEIDATPAKRGHQAAPGTEPFMTIAASYDAARRFNADAAARTCKHCGHQNPPFPIEAWGWGDHVSQSEIARRGIASLAAAGAAPPPGGGPERH